METLKENKKTDIKNEDQNDMKKPGKMLTDDELEKVAGGDIIDENTSYLDSEFIAL